ncbi:sulfatase-like hydrolase/transferase [Natronorubrum aibiense]|uniref:Sulfatase-like hydrolase/transferase n=1 Tax=Natronorubrum aibiense TaxID=348826 RepID=A0A5P9P2D3_9EURY|nr:sulfatase-like hydrolase/transferase [Natronorubrum aibiense]QFU82289.1 sulfatase-like hydrolase/transferase [Natronorubrum aibiense]
MRWDIRMMNTVTPSFLKPYAEWCYQKTRNQYKNIKNNVDHNKRISKVPEINLESKDIVFITVDCLRNDRISRHNDRETTPFLNSSANYSEGVSASSWTYSSVPSLLTGLYPHNHGAVFDVDYRNYLSDDSLSSVRSDVYTLPELLETAGYRTAFTTGITTAQIPLHGRFGSTIIKNDSDCNQMFEYVKDWWEKNTFANGRFAYLQLADLHTPLHEPDKQWFNGPLSLGNFDYVDGDIDSSDFREYRENRFRAYDNLLRAIDSSIESFVNWLDSRRELKDTLIIVTSDHGEEHWEWTKFEKSSFNDPRDQYGVGHGHALVPPVTDVPIYTLGNIPESSETQNSTIDIVPTVLEMLGYNNELDYQFDGESWIEPTVSDRRFLSEETAYGHNQLAVISEKDQFIYIPSTEESYLIDRESQSVVDDFNSQEYMTHLPKRFKTGDSVSIDGETEDQLAALGYLE